MAVPKKKTSRTKRNMRRSHHAVKALRLTTCSRCRSLIPQHTACPTCGTYKGREVLDVETTLDRKMRRQKAKAQQQ